MEDHVTYACTLTPAQAAARTADDRALVERVRATERRDLGLRVIFGESEETRRLVERFVVNESRCCGFFDCTVEVGDENVTLEITAPPAEEAQALVDLAHDAFARKSDRRDG
ncbi:MAG: hypothetical protein ACRDUY_15605 [Nitriliruptorales bacterium]